MARTPDDEPRPEGRPQGDGTSDPARPAPEAPRVVDLDAPPDAELADRWREPLAPTLLQRLEGRLGPRLGTAVLVVGALAVGVMAGYLLAPEAVPAGALAPVARPSAPSSATPSATVVAAPPPIGVCREYTREAEGGAYEESAPVDCAEDHDAITVARIDDPGFDVDFVGNYTLATRAMVMCQREAEHYLGIGAGVTFSRYSSAVYEPNRAQQEEGQHWLRCDLVKFSTWDGMMPVQGTPRGALRKGPGLTDAYCVTPDAVAHGLPRNTAMESPELGQGPGQAECVGRHALVAVRRGKASKPAGAPAACTRESRHFTGLPLTALAPPQHFWNDEVLCVATITDYETWLERGKPLRPST